MQDEVIQPFHIFYSYAHKDEKLRNELAKHLYPLKRQNLIDDWFDRDINAGKEWEKEITAHLNTAHIILLLISPDFMASDYCYGVEMQRALERHEAKAACVIPILLESVDWQGTPFSKLQCLPKNAKAIKKWSNKSDAFTDVAKNIRETLKTLPSLSVHATPSLVTAQEARQEQQVLSMPLTEVDREKEKVPSSPVWHIPHRRNPFFTGRQEILQQIHTMFLANEANSIFQPCVISGLGGIGKTQTAIEYAYQYREKYHTVLWAKADSLKILTNDFASFASVLRLPVTNEHDQQYAVDAVKRWLEVNNNWLLILDNVEDIQTIHDFLPSAPMGHILLTSQVQVTGGIAFRLEIEKLPTEKSVAFLLHRTNKLAADGNLDNVPKAEYSAALAIAEEMDGLPLALDQAGAYIEETGCGLSGYLRLYQEEKGMLLETRGGFIPTHPQSLITTWTLSFTNIARLNSDSTELLRLLAFLHPDAIFEELILKGASLFHSPIQNIANSVSTLNQAIRVLYKYSLVQRNSEGLLTIHRLVQTVLKERMTQEERHTWAEYAVKIICQAFPKVDFRTWPECQKYLPHIQVCATLLAQEQFLFPEAALLLSEAGYYLYEQGQYDEGETLLLQSIAIYEQLPGINKLGLARSLNRIADIYREQGRYDQAEKHYLLAETIYEREAPDSLDLAINLSNKGKLFHIQAKFQQEDVLHQRALKIQTAILGPDHPDTATSLNNLAALYRAQGLYTQARSLYERALSIRERVLGPDHPDTATSLNNLAAL
jgi:tetratricopeptide (TPR) repeat protein